MQQQNNGVVQPISKQWLSKHVPVEMNVRNSRRAVFYVVRATTVAMQWRG
jgi:hypothetical protein